MYKYLYTAQQNMLHYIKLYYNIQLSRDKQWVCFVYSALLEVLIETCFAQLPVVKTFAIFCCNL
jgi:hypothetical protein